MQQVTMPRFSDSMKQGTIVRWLKADGEAVRRGEEIVEIETDKATMAFEAEADGTLSIIAADGSAVAVGTPIATIGEAAATQVEAVSGSDGSRRRVSASPLARRTAQRLGVDLATLTGTGPHGRILKADVVLAERVQTPGSESAPAGVPAPVLAAASDVAHIELSSTQALIAQRMTESRATVPDFALEVDVNMSAVVAMRAELKQVADPAPSLNDFVVKACALALRRHPRANGGYRDGQFALWPEVNVGIAVAAPDALVVPVVRNADIKSLGVITTETRALAERVRSGVITPRELSGGTFTVSNLGMYGIDRFEGIINAPQAAILCVGAAMERSVVREGEIVIAPQMTLTLASDHRILYGADAARFLAEIRTLLERPVTLLL